MEHSSDVSGDLRCAQILAELLLNEGGGYTAVFIGADGLITRWGAEAARLTGWSEAQALGQPFAILFTAEDRARGLDVHELRAAAELGLSEDERWHSRKDGSLFWASGVTMRVPAPGEGFVKVFKDATHLEARTQAMENEAASLRASRERAEALLTVVAHELRNPLAPIKGAIALLSRGQDADRPRALVILERQVALMERLVEDLVDFGRVKAGKLTLNYAVVELQQTLREAVESCVAPAAAKGVDMRVLLPEQPIEVEIDRDRITQVVSNLMSNAIKFTPAGGWASLSATVDRTHVLIQVRDTGIGMGPELLPIIFELFTQALDSPATRGAGLGVGLAVVKEIVSLHRGTVEVRSDGRGKGSEFFVRIPLIAPVEEPPQPPALEDGNALAEAWAAHAVRQKGSR